jgi:hypothetical protein
MKDDRSIHQDEIDGSMMLWDWLDYISGVESRTLPHASHSVVPKSKQQQQQKTASSGRSIPDYEEWPAVPRGPYVRSLNPSALVYTY